MTSGRSQFLEKTARELRAKALVRDILHKIANQSFMTNKSGGPSLPDNPVAPSLKPVKPPSPPKAVKPVPIKSPNPFVQTATTSGIAKIPSPRNFR